MGRGGCMNMLTPILPNDGLYIQLQWESGQILLSISKEGIQRVEKRTRIGSYRFVVPHRPLCHYYKDR